jgi:hypothetical protein
MIGPALTVPATGAVEEDVGAAKLSIASDMPIKQKTVARATRGLKRPDSGWEFRCILSSPLNHLDDELVDAIDERRQVLNAAGILPRIGELKSQGELSGDKTQPAFQVKFSLNDHVAFQGLQRRQQTRVSVQNATLPN